MEGLAKGDCEGTLEENISGCDGDGYKGTTGVFASLCVTEGCKDPVEQNRSWCYSRLREGSGPTLTSKRQTSQALG